MCIGQAKQVISGPLTITKLLGIGQQKQVIPGPLTITKLLGIGQAKQVISVPLTITGVWDQKSVCNDGVIYSVCLPLYSGTNAVLSGLYVQHNSWIHNLGNVEKDQCRKIGGTGFSRPVTKITVWLVETPIS